MYTQVYPIQNLNSPFQYGFMQRRSTVIDLTILNQYIANTLLIPYIQGQVDVIYTDFSKAFGCIDYSLLLHKPNLFGFNNHLISFFKSYLHKRKQYVEYYEHASNLFIQHLGYHEALISVIYVFIVY